jgi:iron complex transport system permease protein
MWAPQRLMPMSIWSGNNLMDAATAAPRLRRTLPSATPDAQVLQRRCSREALVLLGLVATLVAVFLLSLAIGSTWIPLEQVLDALRGVDTERGTAAVVVQNIRLPRSITAVLAGAALGIAGLQMQTLFRNPLADPFALGIMSGASLGVALVVLGGGFGIAGLFGSSLGFYGDAAITAAAIVGAALVLGLVLLVSARIASATTVLILGLMFGYATQAFVTVLVGASEPERLQQWAAWSFGSFSGVTWQRLALFTPLTLFGVFIALGTTKQLNALLLGESYARSMGLAVRRTRFLTMGGASVLGAVVTAFCGPITFLGIAVPHLCRGLLGTSDHRALVPAVILMGGCVALTAQIVALLPGSSGVLPLNAVNSLLGAPIVVFVLLRSRRGAFAA